ncbi:MAG: hypothetical protein M1817_001504 [Caeruleum heppii]|nr:MAG: hypothetical protein M1817_001504 [Caeruleum heppii]
MSASYYHANPAWEWPDETSVNSIPDYTEDQPPRSFQTSPQYHHEQELPNPSTSQPQPQSQSPPPPSADPKPTRHHPPRTCRICLETVLPTHIDPSLHIPGILDPSPSVEYISSDPASGRLLRPCRCRGSSRYVHEGCLQSWRHADPSYGRRNYWECPTCGFRYRLERLTWSNWITSTTTQIVLTVSILLLAMFVLGFVADPIINLYLDPYTTLQSVPMSAADVSAALSDDEPAGWTEHFVKGLASLGLLSFVKVLFAMSPWQAWNLRGSGLIGSGRAAGGTGRDRLNSLSWIVVMIGVGTFLYGVWKGVRSWSRKTLERAGERVMDVQGDDDDEDEAHDKHE